MKLNEAFPSEYLKKDDISGEGIEFTIKGVKMEEFEDSKTKEKESKPVLRFEESEKRLILNVTNWKRIAGLYGDESDKWKGGKIVLHLETVDAFGEEHDVIRVKA